MNDDDLKRLIAADIADHAGDSEIAGRLQTALTTDQQVRALRRAVVAASLVAVALIVVSIGYWLAAMVLPPLTDGGLRALLWMPMIVPAGLVMIALRAALLALAES